MEAVAKALSVFGIGSSFRNKEPGRLRLPGIISGSTVEAIRYNEALEKIRTLKNRFIQKLNSLSEAERSDGQFFGLYLYILALSAQEKMICSLNDGLIASDIPWDTGADIPSVSSTVGDAVSYAERLKDPKDHFLKALLLSFSGWTLLSTEKKECACSTGRLQDLSVDVLVQTDLQVNRGREKRRRRLSRHLFLYRDPV